MRDLEKLKKSILRPVYTLSFLVLFTFASASLLITNYAGIEAKEIREREEHHLISNKVKNQIEQFAMEQSRISHFDETVAAIGDRISQDFLRNRVSKWLWEDYGIQYSVIVAPDHKIRAFVFETHVQKPEQANAFVASSQDLISLAINQYMTHRTEVDGGFRLGAHPIRSEKSVHAMAFRSLNSDIGLVAAQAIIPHHLGKNPNGKPHVLLTFKPFNDDDVAGMGELLGLKELSFAETSNTNSGMQSVALPDDAAEPSLFASWKTSSPWGEIWQETVMMLIGFIGVAGFVLWHITKRHGKTLVELHHSEEQNRYMALHDGLTGLPNRVHFDQLLNSTFEDGKHSSCAAFCIDLDKFKAVNDTYGHHAGDVVIQTAAKRIQNCVGDKGVAARVGGDEFVVLLPGLTDKPTLKILAELIIEQVCLEIHFEGGKAFIGASVGVATWPDQAQTSKEIMQFADEALYRAKDQGRGNVQFFDPNDRFELGSQAA